MKPKDYTKLFEPSLKVVFEAGKPYYYFVMFGNEGLEGLKVVRSQHDITDDTINNMCMRARINSHRSIGVYAFSSGCKVEDSKINKAFLKNDKVIRIF